MPLPTSYKIDLSAYAMDFRELAQRRLLDQFKGKPVLSAVLNAFADEAQEAYDAMLAMVRFRSLYEANGLNLDALGRIVGQRREVVVNDTLIYFQPDTDGLSADQGIAWVPGAPTTGTQPPTEGQYQMQIFGRIKANHNKFSSIPELQAAIKQALGVDVSFVKGSDPMTIAVAVAPDASSRDVISRLTESRDTERVTERFFMGYPATISIATVMKKTEYIQSITPAWPHPVNIAITYPAIDPASAYAAVGGTTDSFDYPPASGFNSWQATRPVVTNRTLSYSESLHKYVITGNGAELMLEGPASTPYGTYSGPFTDMMGNYGVTATAVVTPAEDFAAAWPDDLLADVNFATPPAGSDWAAGSETPLPAREAWSFAAGETENEWSAAESYWAAFAIDLTKPAGRYVMSAPAVGLTMNGPVDGSLVGTYTGTMGDMDTGLHPFAVTATLVGA
jgi:hypothetical protein